MVVAAATGMTAAAMGLGILAIAMSALARQERVMVDVPFVEQTTADAVVDTPIDVYSNQQDAEFPWMASEADCGEQQPMIPGSSPGQWGGDEAVVCAAAKRSRDKRAIDGALNTTVDMYRGNFASELSDAESRVWWGEDDY